ncbi:serine/threonine dehydratase [Actinokineospora diospyrosa]|uniref:L-threonine ammonia-lyase n=1 Tax=Actinokineospora diospyrosa TaxID=103728 RepID=A0ABT1IMY8_9PSEU|nr:serine/threonine dehydratase [Actinokineospora diospyrosa]MCP2274010.1 L-threonine ammonia-lyase (EC 4.3.1.19) [Actinokineospora diospyrosa]
MDHTDVAAAAARIAPHARRTPHLRTEVNGRPVVLKLEHLQRTGSFKFRGALNSLLGGPHPTHVVTASGGNHGVAVATAAQVLGLPATVYVPERAPESKTRRIEAAGAKLVRHGATYAEASAAALTEASESGARYVPAYDDPLVIAGQGTCAAEVVADVPEVDTFVVAVGGGGLAAGTVLGGRGRSVALVEPVDCQAMHDALAAGTPVDAVVNSVAASALGASRVGALPFEVVRQGNVHSVLVSDGELLAARDLLWDEFRVAVEPAAAVPLAGWLGGQIEGKLPCLVICGANSDWVPA